MYISSAATLYWDANIEPDIAGYRVHWGMLNGAISVVDAGNQTSWPVPALEEGERYAFSVSAYNLAGLEGPQSSNVFLEVPHAEPNPEPELEIFWAAANLPNVTGYTLTFGELNTIGTTVSAEMNTSVTLTGFITGKTYYFYPSVQLNDGTELIVHETITCTIPENTAAFPELMIPLIPPAVDLTAPQIAISSPAEGGALTGMATVTVSASDNVGVRRVNFYVDGKLAGYSARAPFGIKWDTSKATPGAHRLQVRATDEAGNAGLSAIVTVSVGSPSSGPDTTAPMAAILSPSASEITSGRTAVLVDASDNVGVSRVNLLVDGRLAGYSVRAPFTIHWNSALYPAGAHTLQLKVADAAGNMGVSKPVTVHTEDKAAAVTGDEIAPTVAFTSPLANEVVNGPRTVTVSAFDNVGVKRVNFYVDGELAGYSARAPFTISWDSSSALPGERKLEVRALDSAGNLSSPSAIFVSISK